MPAEEKWPLDPDEARSAAFDFAAIASERAVVLEAHRQATEALVDAERAAALTLLRFGSNQEKWLAVESAVRTVAERRATLEACSPGAAVLESFDVINDALCAILAEVSTPLLSR